MRLISRRFLLALLASTAIMPTAAAIKPLPPVLPIDEATRDAALVRVRASTIQAVKAKDFKLLQPHLDPRIQLDFGGGSGAAELGRRLARDRTQWDELAWVLENGGRFQQGEFWAPYTFTAKIGNLDVYEAGIIVSDNVPARAEPRADARVVATLGRRAIRVVDWRHSDKVPKPFYNRRDWVKVELEDKATAWIEARFVRANVDYRAGFKKVRGTWKMNAFLAGD
jgi:hypothetical protein